PRCGHADVETPACPRCGVIVAKYRPPRARADGPGSPKSSGAWWPFALLAVVVGGIALLAIPKRQGPGPAASTPPPRQAADVVVVTAADAPPPPTTQPAAAPDPEQVVANLGGIPAADRARAEDLAQRLSSPRSLTAADVESAEALMARFP